MTSLFGLPERNFCLTKTIKKFLKNFELKFIREFLIKKYDFFWSIGLRIVHFANDHAIAHPIGRVLSPF